MLAYYFYYDMNGKHYNLMVKDVSKKLYLKSRWCRGVGDYKFVYKTLKDNSLEFTLIPREFDYHWLQNLNVILEDMIDILSGVYFELHKDKYYKLLLRTIIHDWSINLPPPLRSCLLREINQHIAQCTHWSSICENIYSVCIVNNASQFTSKSGNTYVIKEHQHSYSLLRNGRVLETTICNKYITYNSLLIEAYTLSKFDL